MSTPGSPDALEIPRFSRGKRPDFYDTPGMDEAMVMILVLASELTVARDRIDTLERMMAQKGMISADEIQQFSPDQEALEKREQRRQDLLERLYYLQRKQAHELAEQDTSDKYQRALDEIAQG